MKISIDTKEDSHDDIRKVIKMLQHLVGEDSYSNQGNIFSDNSSPSSSNSNPVGNVFGAMFGDDSSSQLKEDAPKVETYGGYKRPPMDKDIEIIPY